LLAGGYEVLLLGYCLLHYLAALADHLKRGRRGDRTWVEGEGEVAGYVHQLVKWKVCMQQWFRTLTKKTPVFNNQTSHQVQAFTSHGSQPVTSCPDREKASLLEMEDLHIQMS